MHFEKNYSAILFNLFLSRILILLPFKLTKPFLANSDNNRIQLSVAVPIIPANSSLDNWICRDPSSFLPKVSSKYNNEPDFKFIVIEKFLSVENEFALKDGLLLNSYFSLKKISLSDELFFGLDKSDVEIEYSPLIYHPTNEITLLRKK